METPSSLKKIPRSSSLASNKTQKTKKADSAPRSALFELTNNSPIVGVAMQSLLEKTPKSSVLKIPPPVKNTPGSGESLLRGQVKNLLQKVEEEAEIVNCKIPVEERPPFSVLLGLPGPSPAPMVAPTPANTPQISVEGSFKNESIKILDPVVPVQTTKVQEETVISRALLFDSPDKAEVKEKTTSISSTLSYQDRANDEVYVEEEEEEEEEEEVEGEYDDVEGCDDESFNDICAGLGKMTVQEEKVELPEFEGKHTRFVYNSDGEIEGEELIVCDKVVSPNAVILKGLPVPEGKHLRFHEEEEEEDN